MVAAERVADALKPWLGTAFVTQQTDIMRRAAMRLNAFSLNREEIARVAQDLDSLLFMSVRNATAGRMTLPMDTGDVIRVRVSDFALMADELLFLLFEDIAAQPDAFEAVRLYSLRSSSLSSLKALYLLFPQRQTPEELATVERVLRTCHPPFRWRQWLNA